MPTRRRRRHQQEDQVGDEESVTSSDRVSALLQDDAADVEAEIIHGDDDEDDFEGDEEDGDSEEESAAEVGAGEGDGRNRRNVRARRSTDTDTGSTKRGPSVEMREVLRHYRPVGNRNGNYYHLCSYCFANYEQQVALYQENRRNTLPQAIKEVRQRLPTLKNHLHKCQQYKRHLAMARTGLTGSGGRVPPVEGTAQTAGFRGNLFSTPASAVNAVGSGSTVSVLSAHTRARGAQTRLPGAPTPSGIPNYFLPGLCADDLDLMYQLILEFTVETALPFNVVERPSFKRMIDFFRSGSSRQLVKRKVMSDRVLNVRYNEAVARRDAKIASLNLKGHYIALLVDGWETNTKSSLEGVMLKAGPTSFLLTSVQPGTDHHAIAVAAMWEEIMTNHAKAYLPRLRYFLSDDAGQCGRARRILALRHPHILWIKCWAHQVNLMVGHLMSRTSFATVSESAVKAATIVRQSSSKWYARLRTIAGRKYGKQAANTIFTLAETRWNSLQAVFASQLRIRGACELLFHEHKDDPQWRDAFNVWTDRTFWFRLEEAELLIRPFCDASFLMQRECKSFVLCLHLY